MFLRSSNRRTLLPFLGSSRQIAPILLIVVIAIAGLGFLIAHPEGLFNRHSDLLAFHLGTQTVLYDAWRAGHQLPLWRSDIFSGAPAFANPQSMYTHPLHLLFLLDRPERIVGLVIWCQLLLGALGGYYAGSVLRLSVPGRLLVAVSTLFSFKTILAAYAGWLTLIAGLSSMPFLFAATGAAFQRPSLRSALLFGGAGALVLHSGHPQFPYYEWLFVAVWSLVRIGRELVKGDRGTAGRIAGTLILGGVVAAGLSAYVILPIAHNVALVTRWNTSYDVFLGNRPLPPAGLLTVLSPEMFGTPLDGSFVESWELVVYFGAVTSLLALAGAVQGRSNLYVRPLLWGLVISVALGVHSPLTRFAFTFLPGFHLFRLPARVLFLGAFFVFCLAGVGLDVILAKARTATSRRIVAIALVAMVALEGSFWARRYLRVPEAAPYPIAGAYLSSLSAGETVGRVATLGRSVPSYGSAAALRLQLVAGYDPFNLSHYQTYMDLLQYGDTLGNPPVVADRQPNWTDISRVERFDMLAALNVRYLVAPKTAVVAADEYTLVGSFDDQPQFRFYEGRGSGPVYVYRNERPMARAFFVSEVVAAADDAAAITEVLRADLRGTAVVTAASSNAVSAPASGDAVSVIRTAPGQLALSARSVNRRFLVISEVWHPGWRARVDGHTATLARVDVALQGLWLPPGEHWVELNYWPPGLTVGLLLSGMTVFSIIGLMVVSSRLDGSSSRRSRVVRVR